MKSFLRILCLMLALALIGSAALADAIKAADIQNPDTDTVVDIGGGLPTPQLPLVDKPITLTVLFSRNSNHGNFDTMWFLDQVEKETGIRLKIQAIEGAGWTEKMNLSFASDDLPDLFLTGLSASDAAKYGMAGLLMPLNELMEAHSPNAIHLLDSIPNARRNASTGDGKIYRMPAYDLTARDMIHRSASINTAWLSELGMDAPHTLDEFYNALVAFRDSDANGNGDLSDEIPMSFVFNMGAISDASFAPLSAFGFVSHRHDVIDGKYVYVPMQDYYREYLKFMNKLWDENLLDREIFTMTSDQYLAKIQGYILGVATPADMHANFTNEEYKAAYSLIGPLTSDFNQNPCWPAKTSENSSGSFAITHMCKEPVAAIKLLDYFYSDHCSTMTKCGPEEGTWAGEGGWSETLKGDGSKGYAITYDKEKYTGFWDFRCKNGLMNMPFIYGSSQAAIVTGADFYASRVSEMIFDSGCYDARREAYPTGAAFTEEEQDILAMYVLLDTQVDQWVAKFITGEEDVDSDTAWNAYLSAIGNMDVETMISIRQSVYDRWAQN